MEMHFEITTAGNLLGNQQEMSKRTCVRNDQDGWSLWVEPRKPNQWSWRGQKEEVAQYHEGKKQFELHFTEYLSLLWLRIDYSINISHDHFDSFKQVLRVTPGDCYLGQGVWPLGKASQHGIFFGTITTVQIIAVIPANLEVDITRKNTNVRQTRHHHILSLYSSYAGSQFKTRLLIAYISLKEVMIITNAYLLLTLCQVLF